MNKTYDYIVVGAGVAGLVCAYELQKKGFSVLVVESGSVGGRATSLQIKDDSLDLGAGFMMSSYSEMIRISKEVGVEINKADHVTKIGLIVNENTLDHVYPLKTDLVTKLEIVKTAILNIHELFIHDIKDYKTIAKNDAALSTWLSSHINFNFVEEIVNPLSENLFFYNAENFSKNLFFALLRYSMPSKIVSPVGGIGGFTKKLAEKLEVLTNVKIKSINEKDNNVEVNYGGFLRKKKLVAKQVVIAVPGNKVLPLLDNPTENQLKFFSAIKYSSTVKLFAQTKNKMFNEFQRFFYINNPKLSSINFIKQTPDYNLVSIGIQNDWAKFFLDNKYSDSKIISELVKLDPYFKEFKFLKVQRWDSALPVFDTDHIQNVYESENKISTSRLSFCGDYFVGPFMEGAAISGINAAERVVE